MNACHRYIFGHFRKDNTKIKLFMWISLFVFVCTVITFLPTTDDGYASYADTQCQVINTSAIAASPTDPMTCITLPKMEQGKSFANKPYQIPVCDNLMKNIVNGKWVERSDVEEEKVVLDKLLTLFRVHHEGFSACPFRQDGRCGFLHRVVPNFLSRFSYEASSWCAPKSDKPCCTNSMSGICVPEDQCTSVQSVNLAKFVHAEVSDWILNDPSCKMITYDQGSACALLHAKNVKYIGFVGNSLIRNMYTVMLQLLQDNYYNGSVKACVPSSIREKCVNEWQNIDKFCLGVALPMTSKSLPGYGLCNGHLDTLLALEAFEIANTGQELKQHVNQLLDQPGKYLLVGIGVHDQYNADLVIQKYLKPSFDLLVGHSWPKFLWVHQLKTGIFKPPAYVKMHGTDEDIDCYVEKVEAFCKLYKIPTLDLRKVTTGVWSPDGTHYGPGVNLMKIQIFLNFLAAGEV